MNITTPTISQDETITVALVGNPNCGKTSLLNRLTGGKDQVGNYPRVTVTVRERRLCLAGHTFNLVDMPGIYALTSATQEERETRRYILEGKADVIINVIDAGNLERSLYLTTQLVEMGTPMVFALNMVDEVEREETLIEAQTLSEMLGAPVIKTSGRSGTGIQDLMDAAVQQAKKGKANPRRFINFDLHLDTAVGRISQLIHDLHPNSPDSDNSRWLAIKLLEGDEEVISREDEHEHLLEMVRRECYDISHNHGLHCSAMIADARYGYVNGILAEAVNKPTFVDARHKVTNWLDMFFLNRLLGMPIFFGLLWLMFHTTFTVGEIPMGWIDQGVALFSDFVASILPTSMAKDLIVDGVIAGVGGTIIFLPNIVILFFFMAIFSETGYLARAAFLMDRVMHMFGLHGKALIPMVMGFGCNVPAVMATRTIEDERARMVTILVNPFMLCAARLPVFILFAGAFFAEHAGSVVFAMYMISIVGAMGAAVLLSKFFFKGDDGAFVMELPPYRLPTARGIIIHMWDKGMSFLKKIAGVIFVGSIVIWVLQEFPKEIQWSQDYPTHISQFETQPESPTRNEQIARLKRAEKQEALEKSYLGQIALTISPIFEPLGFNWKDTVAILTGLLAKEVVVASYAVIYAQDDDSTEESDSLRNALAANMSPLVAFAFMIFALFYAPCIATLAAIRQEAGGWKWALFSIVFSFSLAWSMAWLIVHVGRVLA
ncbi:ferrous iron transport protein B [Magnetococcus marinus MC-1]|uniref:Ferrous iron transport protein B n=1 Tax=Magnetococcus marinus (strain ATCC BAA-1437 / JCM 17883 / MC-1) TaxID=156889 RepID=A0L8E4_MAGMM|nr:ferrous iron transport protein B [Magnetococcus marinus]ABK44237.1 ferrous iron transport protein B [Magnetococcus marinus MC-1]